MSFKKAIKRKEKKYKFFKNKVFKDMCKNHRIIFSTVQTEEIKMMLMSLDIYNKLKKSLKHLSKWFNKKTTLYGVSANSLDDFETIESTELYDFCERLAEEEDIKILYSFEKYDENIPYGINTSLKLSFNYISGFMLCLKDSISDSTPEQISETFDF